MASTKEMQARARARKQMKDNDAVVVLTKPTKLYNTDELYRKDPTFGFRQVVFPELNHREDTDFANVIIYPANSDKPILAKMTNAGAVYMAWLEQDSDRDHEYMVEIIVRGKPNGIMIQSGVFSRGRIPSGNSEILVKLVQRILNSVPISIQAQFAGQTQVSIAPVKAPNRIGWVKI